jgi:hypothetical protein
MAMVSAFIFVAALALVVAVIAFTLIPAWPRIVDALAGQPAPQPRLVLARTHWVVRPNRRAEDRVSYYREAA